MSKINLEKKLKEIGRRVGELRETRGITQEKLAEKLGVQKRWVSRIENGWDPPTSTLIKIANVLSIDLEDLLKKPKTLPRGRGRPKTKPPKKA